MSMDLARVIADWVGEKNGAAVRIVTGLGGREVVQYYEAPAVIQMELVGRPDGMRPGNNETMLESLRKRVAQQDPSTKTITPQDWMELDREFVQYQQRRKALLMLAANAQQQQRDEEATRLYPIVEQDARHCLEIIEFAETEHPSGALVSAKPDLRPAIMSQQCVAGAQGRVMSNDVDGAVEKIKEGVARVTQALEANGVSDAATNTWVRDLRVLERSVRKQYGIDRTLAEQLEDALAAEDFELAATLRDRIAQSRGATPERVVS